MARGSPFPDSPVAQEAATSAHCRDFEVLNAGTRTPTHCWIPAPSEWDSHLDPSSSSSIIVVVIIIIIIIIISSSSSTAKRTATKWECVVSK